MILAAGILVFGALALLGLGSAVYMARENLKLTARGIEVVMLWVPAAINAVIGVASGLVFFALLRFVL